jgi:uncharacterized membrane protein (DUF373 family)
MIAPIQARIGLKMRTEVPMRLRQELAAARERFGLLTFYQKFEHAVIILLTLLISLVIVMASWNLIIKVIGSIVSAGSFDPTDYAVFQALFGMIFTVIIALEFKRSLLVIAERHESVVQVRTVILIALLAIVRKLLIIDLSATDPMQIFALAATILTLGAVYWLVRDQDERRRTRERSKQA